MIDNVKVKSILEANNLPPAKIQDMVRELDNESISMVYAITKNVIRDPNIIQTVNREVDIRFPPELTHKNPTSDIREYKARQK